VSFLKKYSIIILLILGKANAQSSASTIADSLYALGNYSAAINEYAKVDNEKASLQIARAYEAIGNYKKAVVQYTATLDKNPELDIARFEMGKLLLKTKHYDAALEAFTALISNKGRNPEYFYYIGRVQESMADGTGANNSFRQAIRLDSTHLRSIYSLGKYFVLKQEKDSVLKYVDKGLEFYEEDVSLINLKALAFFNNGEFRQALPYFEQLLELGEEKPFVYKKLAHCYLMHLETEKAYQTYRQLLNFQDFEADAYSGLAEVFLKEQQLDSAQFYIKKAIEERTVVFDNEYRDLGRIARLQGKTKEALDYYTRAWEENKNNQYIHYQVCTLADEYYKDPKTKLRYYESLLGQHPKLLPFIEEHSKKRVSELKEEIHFAAN
jgi:tetratricopeptide (TPR) repeat protein